MGHYFTNDDVKSEIKEIDFTIFDNSFKLLSDNGVFSKDKLDFGTRLFLENIGIDKIHGEVLDVGCGYGPIGIVVASLTDSNVLMCDINKRAIHLCEMNIKNCKLSNISVIESNCYSNIPDDKKFDYILTNPPIRAGKEIVYEIVMNARLHLKEEGTLYIVVRKEQGAKSMINDLSKYYNVDIVEKKKGFFIICCKTC